MIKTDVPFVQGGGKGAYDVNAALAESLAQALGREYEVHFPRMPDEDEPDVGSWKRKISDELSGLHGKIVLVAHSVGGSILLRYLSEEEARTPAAMILLSRLATSRSMERGSRKLLLARSTAAAINSETT